MHDTLGYFAKDPIFRVLRARELTFGLVYVWQENFISPLSHDEVVHGKGSLLSKMPGDRWQRFANLRALFGWMWAHPASSAVHGRRARPGAGVVPRPVHRLAPARPARPPGRAGPGGRMNPLEAQPVAVALRLRARRVPLARRRRPGGLGLRLRPLARIGLSGRRGLRGQPAPRCPATATGSACPVRGRRLAGSAQHRRRALGWFGRGQPGPWCPTTWPGRAAHARSALLTLPPLAVIWLSSRDVG